MKKEELIKLNRESFLEYNTALHELIVNGFAGNKKQKISALENLKNKEIRVFEQLDPATRRSILINRANLLIDNERLKRETKVKSWGFGFLIFSLFILIGYLFWIL